jgi:hypothetical protein
MKSTQATYSYQPMPGDLCGLTVELLAFLIFFSSGSVNYIHYTPKKGVQRYILKSFKQDVFQNIYETSVCVIKKAALRPF